MAEDEKVCDGGFADLNCDDCNKNDHNSAWFANVKRTYDEYQQESLESVKHNRTHFDKLTSDSREYDNQRQNISNQALQNAVETANLASKQYLETSNFLSKQTVRHTDVAVDRQWNVDEVSDLTAKSGAQQDALVTTLAAAIAEILNKAKKET